MKKRFHPFGIWILVLGFFTIASAIPPSLYASSPATDMQDLPLQMIQIEPVLSDIHLVPGKDTTVIFRIKNLSTKPLGIHADISNVIDPSTTQGQNISPLVSWSTLVASDNVLDPLSEKTFSLRIHPPSNAQNGGYAEMVFFTPFVSNNLKKGTPIILSRIGSLILATIGKLNYSDLLNKVHITSFKPQTIFNDRSPVKFDFSINNTYFTYFTAKPFVTITPLFGKPQTVVYDEHHILPNKTRKWQEELTLPHLRFLNFAHLAVSIGEGKQLYADTYFFIIPFKILFLAIGIIFDIICILLIFFNRKRILKTIRILIKGS